MGDGPLEGDEAQPVGVREVGQRRERAPGLAVERFDIARRVGAAGRRAAGVRSGEPRLDGADVKDCVGEVPPRVRVERLTFAARFLRVIRLLLLLRRLQGEPELLCAR